MMEWYTAHRRVSWTAAAVLVVAVAVTVWLLTLPSNDDGLSLGDYGPGKQQEWADRLVAGLNTHDAEQVPVLRLKGGLSLEQRDSIEAAMPATGCAYELAAVQDRGEQRGQQVPGLSSAASTYRFDVTVEERCLGQASRTRELGVVAIAEMGYWEPFYFATSG
ncbi:hypothetical protein C6A86_008670 [Mycobacterium sp. ITM-2016-00316]|uniref:hypothetical protein n=1 Tax=Mycobacterium sp. ITM-2016-00316 TaxID=2099695 RepID=UPI000CF8E4B7|nr:hypothetical protein [Mycobacterium sp. ITM-2016-00316]WNG83711.1 hypothetical protein C6A86_008670 [Mycobacterium sp. ITM-2016-00316]